MDAQWAQQIQPVQGCVLVIIEGLTMYLTEADVKQILSIIDQRFEDVTVFIEILNPKFVKRNIEKELYFWL